MVKTSTRALIELEPGNIGERLRAQAELCREIASQCWNEEIGCQLEELAQLCLRAAGGPAPRH